MTTCTEAQRAEAIAAVREAFETNIAALEAALAGPCTGSIYFWPEYALGAKFDVYGGKSQAVRADLATVCVNRTAQIFNGKGEKARRTSRRVACEIALRQARESYASLLKHLD